MSIKISNSESTLKVNNTLTKNSSTAKATADVDEKQWEPFKGIYGLGTDFLNKMLNIPSTAFTPNFVLPTKEALTKVMVAAGILDGLNTKLKKIANVFSGNNSTAVQKSLYVKQMIGYKSRS